jgi:hypothetical protein
MEIDDWIEGYKVRSFPWIDGKRIYFNVQYYKPGQSLSQPPAFEKTVYLTDNERGRKLIEERLNSFIVYIAQLPIPNGGCANITA